MKFTSTFAAALFATSIFSLPVNAQTASDTTAAKPAVTTGAGENKGKHHGRHHRMRDCSKAGDPAACQAHRDAMKENREKAKEACKDKAGQERRVCMREQMMKNTDCSKARNAERCEARKKAIGECKDKTGHDFKQCMHSKMPARDCAKAGNPQRCEARQKARAACQDKPRGERRQCMQEQMKAK